MTNYQEYKNDFDDPWRRITRQFAALNGQYVDQCDDAVFWYSELANSSLMSTAIWMAGYPCISEVSEVKSNFSGTRGRPTKNNRCFCDLFFYDNDGIGHWVEAKRTTEVVDASEALRKQKKIRGLAGALDDALVDRRRIESVANDYGGHATAMVYVPFTLSPSYYGQGRAASVREERANDLIRRLDEQSTERDFKYSAYFCIEHLKAQDESGHRPFGFAIVAAIKSFGSQKGG